MVTISEFTYKNPKTGKEITFEEEVAEIAKDLFEKTGYPKSSRRMRLVFQQFNNSIEEVYFWYLNFLRYKVSYGHVDKLADVFMAAEHSAFFGVAQQRIGLQQDKVSQFLATVGKMVKELFQLVRELRIIDERLSYYRDSMTSSKSSVSADITLKGIWIDLVEQGSKNPASVYGMAQQLQFVTLPDLFFSVHPKEPSEVDPAVDKLEFNRKVKEVLKRKLRQFIEWKKATYKELDVKRSFTLKYLAQHYAIIKMYMNWVRPYLKNIRRLTLNQKKSETPDLIAAFEGSMIEIEILAHRPVSGERGVHPDLKDSSFKEKEGYNSLSEGYKKAKYVQKCLLFNFSYRTRPAMSYQQEGYNRGPIHVGLVDTVVRAYAWDEDQINAYKKFKEEEDWELLGIIDNTVKDAMEALGGDLEKYLIEAGDKSFEKKKEEKKKEEPNFFDIFDREKWSKSFKQVSAEFGLGFFVPKDKPGQLTSDEAYTKKKEKSKAASAASKDAYTLIKMFKKDHGMMFL